MPQKYVIAKQARQLTLVLFTGAIAVELFGFGQLVAFLSHGLGKDNALPVLLLAALVLVIPFLCWNLLEQLTCKITTDQEGMNYKVAGLDLRLLWANLSTGDDVLELDKEDDEVIKINSQIDLFNGTKEGKINPVAALLHTIAQGKRQIYIYPGLVDHGQLIAEIRANLNNPLRSESVTNGLAG